MNVKKYTTEEKEISNIYRGGIFETNDVYYIKINTYYLIKDGHINNNKICNCVSIDGIFECFPENLLVNYYPDAYLKLGD